MLLGGERLDLPLKQHQGVQTCTTQCLSIPVPYANAIPWNCTGNLNLGDSY